MSADYRIYGKGVNEIHPHFEKKHTWSKVKDEILKKYIDCYLKTIRHRGRPIIIVDAFSGPGQFGDGSKGSPSIICEAIENAPGHHVKIACICSDSHPPHRDELKVHMAPYIKKGIATNPYADFSEALSQALKIGRNATLFFYLDPYGVKNLNFETLKQIYNRDTNQSTEVLINFNCRALMRMGGNLPYSDSASKSAQKTKEAKVKIVNNVMDGNYWQDIIEDSNLHTIERQDRVVDEYTKRVREFFRYTYPVPVNDPDNHGDPASTGDLPRYYLIFGTRNVKGVLFMNDVAFNALKPYFQQFKDERLFDSTRARYKPCPIDKVKKTIIEVVEECPLPMTRQEIYEKVIPKYFMQRPLKDYRAVIDELTFKEQRLFPDPAAMKIKGKLNKKTKLSTKRWLGGKHK